jgi:hypothetical protein
MCSRYLGARDSSSWSGRRTCSRCTERHRPRHRTPLSPNRPLDQKPLGQLDRSVLLDPRVPLNLVDPSLPWHQLRPADRSLRWVPGDLRSQLSRRGPFRLAHLGVPANLADQPDPGNPLHPAHQRGRLRRSHPPDPRDPRDLAVRCHPFRLGDQLRRSRRLDPLGRLLPEDPSPLADLQVLPVLEEQGR